MMNGGSDAVQVMYMEVEGIKLAYQVSKDAARLAKQLMTFLIRAMMDAPYRKVSGKTNIKNLKSRSNGQAMVAVTVNKKIYRKLQKDAKKYGILYHAFEPLKSGKKDSVELIIAEKDLSMLQELLSRYKNEQIKEDVKCGLSKEQSERNYEENNRTETMEEFTNGIFINKAKEKEVSERYVKELATKTPSGDQLVVNLSGGNQQKVVIAKWLTRDSDILIFDEPTRGIDVGAKYEIYQLIIDLANKGKVVLMVSSEMPELLGVCDRILVMSGGKLAGEVDAKNTTQEEIMSLAAKYV